MNRFSRAYAILLLALVILTSIAPVGNYDGNEKKYLPKTFKKLRFGMSLEAIKKLRGKLTDISEEGYEFRKVFNEKINKDGIVEVSYYFDNEGDFPIYEMIIVYESEVMRDKVATKLLGAPNYKSTKWKMDIGEDYPLVAWSFKNKLVYAIPLKGSEWEEGL